MHVQGLFWAPLKAWLFALLLYYSPLFDPVLPGLDPSKRSYVVGGGKLPPLCSAAPLLLSWWGQLSERHQGAKNNMVKNLNNKLLGIQGCAASRLPLTFPKRIVQSLSIYSRPVQWGQNSRVVKYFGSRFFHSFPMMLLINIFAEASLPKEIAIIFMWLWMSLGNHIPMTHLGFIFFFCKWG